MISPGTVLLHDTLNPLGQNLLFTRPREILCAYDADSAGAALERLQSAQAEGQWAAGYFAYELGYLFEERLTHLLPAVTPTPLLWFGLYDAPQKFDRDSVLAWLEAQTDGNTRGRVINIRPSLNVADYAEAFAAIKFYIAAGDVYQINLTFKALFELEGDAVALYRDLVRQQNVAYGALIATKSHTILSRSPELFIASSAGTLRARPMKGTRPRGRSIDDDELDRTALANDPKNRAENLMITDLLRNDLGRIAHIGTVEVTDLFSVETYRSLHTMTSGITATLRPGLGTSQILANLFPCGSITGAPKMRAMEIIASLEAGPRGLYTGAIGYFAPSGDFCLNVAIRTLMIDQDGHGEIGIGGGIVADSILEAEYDEALLKMKFLTDPPVPVALIETMRWDADEGYYLLDRHLDRLLASCRYFRIECQRQQLEELLAATARDFAGTTVRVRLLLDEVHGPSISAVPLPPNPAVFRFCLSPEPLQSGSIWLAHKTTNRAFYDEPRQAAAAQFGVDEVVFCNETGELTEGSITNIFVERDGVLLTPPLSAGLLPGTLRAALLASGRASEARLIPADLTRGDSIYLGNSVRGLLPAQFVDQSKAS
ncbi:aminodeoxychorismate synthase component I [Devosia algicola]|uniref:Probable branched-chain-amino-acid aminotransferase n=1 Tax=Devosia algicola TaxID=3026418 RepID=A0ABY7YKQ7_9HYPH|nr:aminodeoxychorismate synthase component I [Devosia algicola]WDR01822.1 aminodeoxychorismate synthase component I [Devosia algicola]